MTFRAVHCIVFLIAIGQVVRSDESGTSDREEKIRARLSEFAEHDMNELDVSGLSAEDLVRRVVESSADPGPYFQLYCAELASRGADARRAISAYLSDPSIRVDALAALPKAAGYIDLAYQVEIAKACLFHEKAQQIDDWSIGQGGLLELIARSPKDETEVLDKLVGSGRLESGSELEMFWRASLAAGDQASRDRTEPREDSQRPASSPSDSLADTESGNGDDHNWALWSAGCMLMVALVVFFVSRRHKA